MNFTLNKIAAGLVMAVGAVGAHAVPVAFATGEFVMYNASGVQQDADSGSADIVANVTGNIDVAAGTFAVASTDKFQFKFWTASGGTLYNPGTYTINVNGDGASGPGVGDLQFTVGAGQIGGKINFAWGTNTGIDVFNVWNVSSVTAAGFTTTTYTSSNMNALANTVFYNGAAINPDTWAGLPMVDGPFVNFSANFNFTTVTAAVPEASTYGMMLAGLGLVGFAVRRRKFMA